jgi:LytTr DNA-binding domain
MLVRSLAVPEWDLRLIKQKEARAIVITHDPWQRQLGGAKHQGRLGGSSQAPSGGSSVDNGSSFAFGDSSWQEPRMEPTTDRVLLHLGRDRRRAIDAGEVYFLEATGEATLVRLRSSKRFADVRALGKLGPLLAPFGIVRVHRNHAVNVHHVLEIRRRSGDADWEVKLDAPVNEVLPVGRTYLKRLWAAFGEH